MSELDLFTNTWFVINAIIIICRILQSIRTSLVTLQSELTVNLCFLSYFMSNLYMSIDDATEIKEVGALALVYYFISISDI